MTARGIGLRAIVPSDFGYLYELSTHPEIGFRWRNRGTTPSPQEFENTLFAGVFTQFVFERVNTGQPLGLVTCFGAHPRDGHAQIALVADPATHRTGAAMGAAGLFIDYIFRIAGFRKLYFEATEFNLQQYKRGASGVFVEEGRLRGHEYYAGRFWDTYIMAIYAEVWQNVRGQFSAYLDA